MPFLNFETRHLHLSVTIAIVFGLILYACLKMKTFEYESFMEVITIRQSYLWKMNSHQHPIEFPNDILKVLASITDYSIGHSN